MFSSPATSNLRSSLNFNSAFPKLLYLGPKFSLGHLNQNQNLNPNPNPNPSPLILIYPFYHAVVLSNNDLFFGAYPCTYLCVSLVFLDLQTRVGRLHVVRDRHPQDIQHSVGFSVKGEIIPEITDCHCSLGLNIHGFCFGLDLGCLPVAFAFALFQCNPELCCRSPPFGARNTLPTDPPVCPASDSSVTLVNSSRSLQFSRSNCSSSRIFF